MKNQSKLFLLVIGSACILLAFFLIYQSVSMYNRQVDEILARPTFELVNNTNGLEYMYETNFQKIMIMNQNPHLQRFLRQQNYTPFSVDVFDFYINMNTINSALRFPDGSWNFTVYSMNKNIFKGSFIKDISELLPGVFDSIYVAPRNNLLWIYHPQVKKIGLYLITSYSERSGFNTVDSLIVKELLISTDVITDHVKAGMNDEFPFIYLFGESDAIISGSIADEITDSDFIYDDFISWIEKQRRDFHVLQNELFNGDTIFVFVPKQYVREQMANFFAYWAAGAVLLILFGGLSIMIAAARLKTHFAQAAKVAAERNELEIELLQSLINPHLLYNSLGGIKHAKNDPNRIKIIDDLIAFYRIALNRGNVMLTVSQEAKMADLYLEIQKFAYDADFDYSIDIEDDLAEKMIPKNLIQPLVENAFLHGLSKRKETDHIFLSVRRDSGDILITVSDTGEGMDLCKVERINNNDPDFTGYGLSNIRKRIDVHYGTDYGITVESEIGKGTTVYMRIPD